MNPYLNKLLINLLVVLAQGLLILEIERYWLLLKGKKSKTVTQILKVIRLPFYSIKNPKTVNILAFIVTPLLFGFVTMGIIPYLNIKGNTNISLGYPWGHVATYFIGAIGMYLLLGVVGIEVLLAKTKPSIQLTGILIIVAMVFLCCITYWHWSWILDK